MNFITSMTMVDRIIGSAPFVYEGDFVTGIKKAKELGYDGVELHIADPAGIDVPALKEALAEAGMSMTAVGTGRAYVNEGLSLTDTEEAGRKAAVKRMENFLVMAGSLGARVIVGCMRGNIASEAELSGTLKRLRTSMEYLDAFAGEQGTRLVFEPINRYENNFLCSAAEIAAFISENELKHTGILLDTFHMNIEEADLYTSIRENAGKIEYVHIADSNRQYPGCGHLDFAKIVKTLDETGYHGVLSAECLPLPSKEAAAAGWLKNIKSLRAQKDGRKLQRMPV